jgi:dTDP-4-dehydrorhamnose 3,5-epimerase
MTPRVTTTALDGVLIIDLDCFEDDRGFFYESWNARDFAAAGLDVAFVQESHSRSRRGVVRGIHFQDATAPLGKLVRCTAGGIFDVAVDLRFGSPTFAQWVGVELSAANRRQLYVPPGFGHGLQALENGTEVQYKQNGYWTPSAERILAWNDPAVGITWPIANPILSNRDQRGTSLREYIDQPAFAY